MKIIFSSRLATLNFHQYINIAGILKHFFLLLLVVFRIFLATIFCIKKKFFLHEKHKNYIIKMMSNWYMENYLQIFGKISKCHWRLIELKPKYDFGLWTFLSKLFFVCLYYVLTLALGELGKKFCDWENFEVFNFDFGFSFSDSFKKFIIFKDVFFWIFWYLLF